MMTNLSAAMVTDIKVETNTDVVKIYGTSLHNATPNFHVLCRALTGVNGIAKKQMAKSLMLRHAIKMFVVVRIVLYLTTT